MKKCREKRAKTDVTRLFLFWGLFLRLSVIIVTLLTIRFLSVAIFVPLFLVFGMAMILVLTMTIIAVAVVTIAVIAMTSVKPFRLCEIVSLTSHREESQQADSDQKMTERSHVVSLIARLPFCNFQLLSYDTKNHALS